MMSTDMTIHSWWRSPKRLGLAILVILWSPLFAAAAPVRGATPDPADDPHTVVLATLRPTIAAAKYDRPRVYRDGCHVAAPTTRPISCIYGVRTGRKVVVIVGDSIMAQWWAALDGAARRGSWRIVWMTKSGCPAADVTVRSGSGRYAACDTWRRNVLAKVRGLARVDLLVMGGSSQSTVLRRSSWAAIVNPMAKAAEWQAGYERTVRAVAGQVRRVVILRDTPTFLVDVPRCLATHGGSTIACSRLRASALSAPYWQAERAVDAQFAWVHATDMAGQLCQPTRCWPVTSSRILRYRDRHHLTNTYAAVLAPAMYSRLRWLMR
jgi:SGNH domain-containing protein